MSGGSANLDHKYMYEFCTKRCNWKGCPKDATCVDAHSKAMSRRVPMQLKSMGGLFNYIPEQCPQYKWKKRCTLGENCFRAHGWLEIIFHPLLYKTKLCKSTYENGVCKLYGIYCAKAHKRNEMRNLAKIYGKNWKSHYDISQRELLYRSAKVCSVKNVKTGGRQSKFNPRMLNVPVNPRVSVSKSGKSNNILENLCGDISLRSSILSITGSESSESLPSKTSDHSPLDFGGFRSQYGEEQIRNYIDLYDKPSAEGKNSYDELKESVTSNHSSVPTVTPSTNRSPDAYSFYSEDMETSNNLDCPEKNVALRLGTAWDPLRWTGARDSSRGKLTQAMRSKQVCSRDATARTRSRCKPYNKEVPLVFLI